jgi:branched-chain amino acid transport system substrate-binding protein
MRKLIFVSFVCLMCVVLAVPVIAQDEFDPMAAHTACADGVDLTGQTITLYHFGDLSGPFSFITQPLLASLTDAFAYFNERGGICGANLAQEFDDTAGVQDATQAIYDRFSTLDPKPNLVILYASADAELLRDQLAEDEIPVLISAGSVEGLYGADGQSPGWIFATNPLYVDQLGMFCDYVAANPERFPDPVLGHISWEGAFGRSSDTAETRAYCEAAGVGYAGAEYFLPTATDITSQIQNLLDNGANILYTTSLASGPALVAATVVNMGIEDSVTISGVNWALDTSVGLLGQQTFGSDGLPSTNGLVGSLPFLWWTERAEPGIALINAQADANQRPPQVRNIAYILGWTLVDLYIEAYILTGNRVGYDNIDGVAMKETLETMQYEPMGGLLNVEFGADRRALSNNRIAQMAYLGQDGQTPAGADNPPMVVQVGEQQFLVPILVPLTAFQTTPDLRPGGE